MANKLVRSDGPVLAMRAMDADVHNCRAFAVAMAIPMWREWWGTPLEDPKNIKKGVNRGDPIFSDPGVQSPAGTCLAELHALEE